MVGSPRILTEDQGLVILKLSMGLGRYCAQPRPQGFSLKGKALGTRLYCAELQKGAVRGPCLGALQLLLAFTGLGRKLHGLKFISSKQANECNST